MSYFVLPIQLLKFKCSLKRMDNLCRGRESFFLLSITRVFVVSSYDRLRYLIVALPRPSI